MAAAGISVVTILKILLPILALLIAGGWFFGQLAQATTALAMIQQLFQTLMSLFFLMMFMGFMSQIFGLFGEEF